MRLAKWALVLVASAVLLSGCGVNEAFVSGVDEYANRSGLLDEYDRYIDADPKLSGDTKKIRKNTSRGLRRLIEEAKKANE